MRNASCQDFFQAAVVRQKELGYMCDGNDVRSECSYGTAVVGSEFVLML